MTLSEYWETKFVPEHVDGQKPSSQDTVETAWRLHIGLELGDLQLRELDASRIIEFRRSLRPKLPAASSRNKVVRLLGSVLRHASPKYLSTVPKVKEEAVIKAAKPIFARDEILSIVAAGKSIDLEHEVFVLLLIHGCLRIGEVNGLHWTDLDLDRRTMKAQRTEWMHTIYDAPNGHVGTVPLSEALYSALVRWRAEAGGKGGLVLPYFDPGEKVWRCRHGSGLLKAVLSRAGTCLEGPHLLRHTVLSHLAEDGVSPYALQAFARHAHMSTTMKYYVHLEQAKLAGQALDVLQRSAGHPARSVTSTASAVTPTENLRLVRP